MSTQATELQVQEAGSSRNRSFGGCATCRSRHVKCDEGLPTCSMCQYGGLDCGGYEKTVFFDFENDTKTAAVGVARYRRHLLTDEERKCMTQWLVSSVPPRSTLRVLAQIDDQCDRSSAGQQLEIQRGPFGVFRMNHEHCASPARSSSDAELETDSAEHDLAWSTKDCVAATDPSLSPWTHDLVQAIFNQTEQISVTGSPDLWKMTSDPVDTQGSFWDHVPMSESQAMSNPQFSSDQYSFPQYIHAALLNRPAIDPYICSHISSHRTIPQDAVTLLKHYATTVITLLTPVRHTKTPWHILFIPHIKNCLAALTLDEQLDHGSLAAFYGTLAISAVSLGGVSQSPMWLEKGRTYKQLARGQARLMLKTAYDVPKTAKYKTILMALLTMVQLSMFAGTRDQTDCYLVEAEKFIRLRGLSRKKSRKVRLLHHCYVFERLFHESTFLRDTDSPQRQHVRKVIESSGLAVHSRDSLSFRLPNFSNLEEEMSVLKSQETGENDLHLELPGEFPPTLYPEIFGVPEPWMLLLSLTIRLGKEKDSAETEGQSNALSLSSFMARAKAIERRIHLLQRLTSGTTDAFSSLQSEKDLQVLDNMLEAVRQALVIYFYRRIYDLDASMLQQHVAGVRDCLLRCEYADPSVVHGSAGLIWPAFMAACEAEDSEVQTSFSYWFKSAAQRSGLSCFTDTLGLVEQIWHEKRTSNGLGFTWLDIMKKKEVSS